MHYLELPDIVRAKIARRSNLIARFDDNPPHFHNTPQFCTSCSYELVGIRMILMSCLLKKECRLLCGLQEPEKIFTCNHFTIPHHIAIAVIQYAQ